jgi:SAM-dependent methyltransferase
MADVHVSASFYERFWADAGYTFDFALHAAVHARFPAILKVWGSMLAPQRVLDFGCGNGVLTYWMHCNGFGKDIVGLDISATAIAFANCHLARPGLTFQTFSDDVDLSGLGPFDLVTASHVLEHLTSPEQALARMAALGEWLVLEVPLEDCLVPRLGSALGLKPRARNPVGHVNFWTRRDFRAFVESAGLIVVRDFQYAAAPFAPSQPWSKRIVERTALGVLGVPLYGRLLATHYAVLARPRPSVATSKRRG